MKKRKELDALVSSRAPPGRELLKKHESDSSDMEDYAVLAPYRLPPRKKHGGHGSSRPACVPVCLVLVAGAAAAGALVWLHLGLRRDFDTLRAHLGTVDAENKRLPGTLHGIHSQLKQLEQNLTSLVADIRETAANVTSLTKEVSELKQTTSELQESVAAAHKIMKLPTHFEDITKNAARIGSDVTSLRSEIKILKEQQDAMQGLEARVTDMQVVLNNTLETNETLFQRYGALDRCVEDLNASLATVVADLRRENEELERLKDACDSNCTREGHASSASYQKPEELLTKVMADGNVTRAIEEARRLVSLYKRLAQRLDASVGGDDVGVLPRTPGRASKTAAARPASQEPGTHEATPTPSGEEAATTTAVPSPGSSPSPRPGP